MDTHFNVEPAVRKNSRLPNLHNLGIHLRILLIVNVLGLLAAILQSQSLADFFPTLTALSTIIQPIILLSMLSLYSLYPWLDKLPYAAGLCVIIAIETLISTAILLIIKHFFWLEINYVPYRAILLTVIITAIVLYYFYLQQRAYSPAIAEARLQALQARIRPHFLFNSINAVLSLIRTQPKQAENALEDLADLFRVLMADNRDLVPLSKEIALCKQYLSIESLRLAERLSVDWTINNVPDNVMIPPLILQPLLENAVYHGIEPIADGGKISVNIITKRQELHMHISNPCRPENDHHRGNKMALKNIKERLQLHYDLEASFKTRLRDQQFNVYIRLPYQNA